MKAIFKLLVLVAVVYGLWLGGKKYFPQKFDQFEKDTLFVAGDLLKKKEYRVLNRALREMEKPLDEPIEDQRPELAELFAKSRIRFENGKMTREEAYILANTIKAVQQLNQDRLRFEAEFQNISTKEISSVKRTENKTLGKNRMFLLQNQQRLWNQRLSECRGQVTSGLQALQ